MINLGGNLGNLVKYVQLKQFRVINVGGNFGNLIRYVREQFSSIKVEGNSGIFFTRWQQSIDNNPKFSLLQILHIYDFWNLVYKLNSIHTFIKL